MPCQNTENHPWLLPVNLYNEVAGYCFSDEKLKEIPLKCRVTESEAPRSIIRLKRLNPETVGFEGCVSLNTRERRWGWEDDSSSFSIFLGNLDPYEQPVIYRPPLALCVWGGKEPKPDDEVKMRSSIVKIGANFDISSYAAPAKTASELSFVAKITGRAAELLPEYTRHMYS